MFLSVECRRKRRPPAPLPAPATTPPFASLPTRASAFNSACSSIRARTHARTHARASASAFNSACSCSGTCVRVPSPLTPAPAPLFAPVPPPPPPPHAPAPPPTEHHVISPSDFLACTLCPSLAVELDATWRDLLGLSEVRRQVRSKAYEIHIKDFRSLVHQII